MSKNTSESTEIEYPTASQIEHLFVTILGKNTSVNIKYEAEIPDYGLSDIGHKEFYGQYITAREYIKITSVLYPSKTYYFAYDKGDKDFYAEFLEMIQRNNWDTPLVELFTFSIYPSTQK